MKIIRQYTRLLGKWMRNHFELLCWVAAIIVLFFLPEEDSGTSLCLFKYLGFSHCPGCGIGHSIRDALHGQFSASFHHHPLGIVAVMIIFNRIKQLFHPINQNHEA